MSTHSRAGARQTGFRRGSNARGPIVGFVAIAALLTGAVLVVTTAYFGRVSGQEFSPHSFHRRQFSYYEIPLLGLQVSPVRHKDCTGSLESYLVGEKLIPIVRLDSAARWDLVQAYRGYSPHGSTTSAWGDAKILCQYLDTVDGDGRIHWLEWSKAHQSLARVLWPAVAKLAREELYFFAPDPLALANVHKNSTDLKRAIDETLSKKCMHLARCQQRLGRHDSAVGLFTQALQYAPELTAALQGRAASLSLLGKRDLAAADLAQARQFEGPL